MIGENSFPLDDLKDSNNSGMFNDGSADSEVYMRNAADLEHIFDVPVQVSAVLGRSKIGVGELLRVGPGYVLELDRKVGEAIEIHVNDRLVARGEVVLVDGKLGVTMTEIVKSDR